MDDVIWSDPQRMGGEACFRGTRVPVQVLLDYLADGATIDGFIAQFPTVTRDQVVQLLRLLQRHVEHATGHAA